MDGQSTTAESKHHYQQPTSWPRASSASSTPRANSTTTPDSSQGYFPTHLDLLPILFPHQSSVYQDKLLQYNKLLSASRGGGGGLQTPPLPPALSSPLTQHAPHTVKTTTTARSRSSSKVSNKDNLHTKLGAQSCHGNRSAKNIDIAERVPIMPAKEAPSNMSAKKHSEQQQQQQQQAHHQQPNTHGLPARPPPSNHSHNHPLPIAQSSSVPSTPHQHARKFSFESREQSPGATQNHSPRSAYSDTNGSVPSLRPLPPRLGGCRFETAIPHSRRRMPYNLGTDRLPNEDPEKIKSRLSEDDERKLTADMRELYDRLLPTKEVEINRQKLVQKLKRLLNEEWPGHDIQVHLFGSSGNLLCSDDSDVDICITTEWKELENVCLIADLLDRHGMEKVVCVSSAKVPIVKIWDPELNLACDMNVNNTLALENTRMVRTYVEIDERMRPLAMIIKYWTRRRIVNDAAFGGTLSSYTWICMIIAFLQLRDPPVLPALHQHHNQKLKKEDGTKSEFADDIDSLRGFGAKNKDSLAALLFQFFKFYAHEFDYDNHALSIRFGRVLTKIEKRWNFGTNNVLCIEEPFNTIRNLGNTADDTSFRGLHLELRRAFDLISEGKFEECCEEYVYPREEERVWQKRETAPRPILVRSASQHQSGRGGRAGFRGTQRFHRNGGNANRRASSSIANDPNAAFAQANLPVSMNPHEILWYNTHHSQLGIPQDILNTSLNSLNVLAAHETNLRFQLYTQAQQINQQQALAHAQRMQGGSAQSTDRSRTNSFDNPPLTAPIRSDLMYGYGYPVQHAPYFHPGFTTYPSSPASAAAAVMSGAASEYRRSLHRSTATNESGGSTGSGALRSQSQPASRTPMAATQGLNGYPGSCGQPHNGVSVFQPRQANGGPIPSFMSDEATDVEFDDGPTRVLSESPPEDMGLRHPGPGYYSNENSSLVGKGGIFPSAIPAFSDLSSQAGRRRLSTDQLPQSILDRRMKRTSRSPSPLGHSRAFSVGTNSAPLASAPFQQSNGMLTPNRGPVVVSSSAAKTGSSSAPVRQMAANDQFVPEDANFDNPLHIHQGPGSPWVDQVLSLASTMATATPPSNSSNYSERPVIVNGSSVNRSPATGQSAAEVSFQHRAMGAALHNAAPFTPMAIETNGVAGFSPPSTGRPRMISRQQQNGIAPLDLATGDFTVTQDLQHLSPVYENRSPSPTVVRRFDAPIIASPLRAQSGSGRELRSEFSRGAQKSSPVKSPPTGPSPKLDSASRSPILETRLNGLARENGHVRAAKSQSENLSVWQKSKPRKKCAADPKQAVNGFAQSEQLPKNDADRKGG
ncbi:hypothetical protein B0T17DRAFT_486800 [Bombardia bombarda]|uniref:polynucleotide adenylyltransferase n=1 Tax=Bombardia bombarda TaxID=252184 RepID=A0AA40C8M4_9PEZI|nr:hypothetical protein B0T17DRAFT_486800 [Bombardia bombarda]